MFLLFQIVLLIIPLIKCANILGIFPAPGYSQFILGEKLMLELAKKNHNVTVISPYSPSKTPDTYKTISAKGPLKLYKDIDFFKSENAFSALSLMKTQQSGLAISEEILKEPNVQNLLHSNSSFDLVIVEQFFCEVLMGFAKHFDAPLVLFSSIGPSEWNNHMMGNPHLPSYMPITKLPYSTSMSTVERIHNAIVFIFDVLYKHYITYPKHDDLLKKYFPKPIDLEDVMYNTSLMLLGSHYSISDPFPLVPGMVEIGGFHITTNSLPQNLQKILDEAPNGAIYFSMGTNLKISNLKSNTLQDIVKVFGKLKQRILWKCDEPPPNLPQNVLTAKWLPQNDILAHKNVKLFVSHGGLLSTTEAVHFGVPILGIPIFGDQKMNMAKAERSGFALTLPYSELSGESLYKAIKTVLKETKYREEVQMRSRLYHDRPIKPMDLAVYWVEHVLRYGSGKHLRFVGMELRWYQMYLLAVLGGAVLVILLVAFLLKGRQKLRAS